MEITITMGWWLLPLVITLITFSIATLEYLKAKENDTGGYLGDFGSAIAFLFCYGLSIIFSLLSWLIYFIIY